MRNKKLIEKFIKDNFDLTNFNLTWENNWRALLEDTDGNTLEICTFDPEEIWTMINDVKHLKYRLKECNFCHYWVIVND